MTGRSSRALVFQASGQPLEPRTIPTPRLGPGEVLVRVTACTLCGSDLHTYFGRRATPTPTILGHEVLGRVEAIGSGPAVRDLSGRALEPGDRITWSIAASCGGCFFCQEGLPQKCENLLKYGHERIRDDHALSGGLAEYCHLASRTAIVTLPESLPEAVACPANCATATVAGAFRVGGGVAGKAVLIQGAGLLGLTATAMACARGAREVIVSDVDRDRLDLARRFGASRTVVADRSGDAFADAVRGAGRGVDLALELSGSPQAIEDGLGALRMGGRYVLVGSVYPTRPVRIVPETVVRRLLNLHGLHNYTPGDLAEAVAFLTEHHHRFPFADLVAARFTLSDADAAFAYAQEHRAIRVMVEP